VAAAVHALNHMLEPERPTTSVSPETR
jgi:hypothetical protein